MAMSKRSMAELRKLRKRDEIFVDAMAEIKAASDLRGVDDLFEAADRIKEVIDWSVAELAEVEKKETFLQKLELPKHDELADHILQKIRRTSRKGIQ